MGIDSELVVEDHRGVVGVVVAEAVVVAVAVELVDMAADPDCRRPSTTTTSTTASRPGLPNVSFKVISETASTEGRIIMVGGSTITTTRINIGTTQGIRDRTIWIGTNSTTRSLSPSIPVNSSLDNKGARQETSKRRR
jgi:hypothetical protein